MTRVFDTLPVHGGRLSDVSRRYGIERGDWLDLSTGINPWPYPITPIDARACQALPDHDLALLETSSRYYLGSSLQVDGDDRDALTLFNIPGSQWAIEQLPHCVESGIVALPNIGYREHEWRWQQAGHQIRRYDADHPESVMDLPGSDHLRAMVVINPNNPGGQHIAPCDLRALAASLQQKGTVMVVDEAFVDATPEQSLLPNIADNVIILRSLGKFFGLAGLRLGAVIGKTSLTAIHQLSALQGPWRITSPSQKAGAEALEDHFWQRAMRATLKRASHQQGAWLEARLNAHGDIERWRQSALFNGFDMEFDRARRWHEALLSQGVLTRLWEVSEQRAILRFGLHDESPRAIQHLEQAMSKANKATGRPS
ncbi:threonine-phosphate decarboxylase [Kushneria konosiri]|nr:threonine-phosphate decarboxylase [Kushneria konosiri]